MGRKGMKGFMKSASRSSNKPEDEEAEQQQQQAPAPAAAPTSEAAAAAAAAKPAPAAPAAAAAAPAPAPAAAAAVGPAGSDDEDEGGAQGESRSKMLQRHKKELLAHRKAVQRMGKKSKDEIAKLDAELAARHAKELQDLDTAAAAAAKAAAAAAAAPGGAAGAQQAAAAADGSAAAADSASKYLKDLSVGDEGEGEEAGGKGKKQSKAQRRREKAAAKDAEREARIAAELESLGPSERATEEAALQELLAPLGLAVKEIRADGHCLYRSLEDQLDQTAAAAAAGGGGSSGTGQQYNYQELRELAADYIREHKDQFSPFLLPEDEGQDPEEHYEQYCYTLETTAAWGGHLELTALSAALKRPIHVHAVGMDTIRLGEAEFSDKPALEVCYLRHAFGLGEHYNSTKKLLFGAAAMAEEEEESSEVAEAGGEEAL